MFSANGDFCLSCPKLQTASSDETQCVCATGAFNTSVNPSGLKCVHKEGSESAVAVSTNTSECETCAAVMSCVDCSTAGVAVPRRGFWGQTDRHLYECETMSACLGGWRTPCDRLVGHTGVTCAACDADFVRAYDGRCERCTEATIVWVFVSLLSVGWVVCWALHIAATRLQEGFLAVVRRQRCETHSRILLSFLQLQTLIAQIAVPWAAPTKVILTLEMALSDPSAFFVLNRCALQTPGSVYEFTLALLVLWLLPAAILCACGCVTCFRAYRQRRQKSYGQDGAAKPNLKKVGQKVLSAVRMKFSKASKLTREEKIARIFERFDTDEDGVLHHEDIAHMASELEDSEYDDQAFLELCEAVGVKNPRRGLELHDFSKQFYLSGSGGDASLDEAYAQLFPIGVPQLLNKPESSTDDGVIYLGGDVDNPDVASGKPQAYRLVTVAAWLFYLAHPSMLQQAMNVLACKSVDSHLAVLSVNPGVECYNQSHRSAVSLTIPPLVLFGGLPICFMVVVYRRKGQLQPPLSPLVSGLRWPEWEVVVTGRKIFMAVVVVISRPWGGFWQIFAALAIVQAALLLQWWCNPLLDVSAARLESLGLVVSFVTLLAGATGLLRSSSHDDGIDTVTVSIGTLCALLNLGVVMVGLSISFRPPRRARLLAGACLKMCLRLKKTPSATGVVGYSSWLGKSGSEIAPSNLRIDSRESTQERADEDQKLVQYLDDADCAISRDELRHAAGNLNQVQKLLAEQQAKQAAPALRLLEELCQQVHTAAIEAPELAEELQIIAAQVHRIKLIGSQFQNLALELQAGWHGVGCVPGAARRYLRDDFVASLLDKEAADRKKWSGSGHDRGPSKSSSSLLKLSQSQQSQAVPVVPPVWLLGCDFSARKDKLHAVFHAFDGVQRAGGVIDPPVLRLVLRKLGFRCSVEEAAATIEAVIRGALNPVDQGQRSGENNAPPRLNFEEFVTAVTSVADTTEPQKPAGTDEQSAAEAAVDEFLAEVEPDWGNQFVVGKYLAALVEATPEVQARRAAEEAVAAAKKNGNVDQALAISPFWAMRPHELRALLEGLDTPMAAEARERRPLKSELVRLLVESDIYNKARAAKYKYLDVPLRKEPPRPARAPGKDVSTEEGGAEAAKEQVAASTQGFGGWVRKTSTKIFSGFPTEPPSAAAKAVVGDTPVAVLPPAKRTPVSTGSSRRSAIKSVRAGVESGAVKTAGRVAATPSFAQRAIGKVGVPKELRSEYMR